MRAVVGSQRHIVLTVEPGLVEVRVVRILTPFLTDRFVRHGACDGIDPDDSGHRPDAARDPGLAGERLFPAARWWVPAVNRRLHEVHVADISLVLLLRRNLLTVGRPRERRRCARRPTGVARSVSEVLHAVGRELAVLAGG